MQVDQQFKDLAKPLAEYLARFTPRSEIHKYVVADLYDLVNEVRDAKIAQARSAIAAIRGIEGTLNEAQKAELEFYRNIIRQHQGA